MCVCEHSIIVCLNLSLLVGLCLCVVTFTNVSPIDYLGFFFLSPFSFPAVTHPTCFLEILTPFDYSFNWFFLSRDGIEVGGFREEMLFPHQAEALAKSFSLEKALSTIYKIALPFPCPSHEEIFIWSSLWETAGFTRPHTQPLAVHQNYPLGLSTNLWLQWLLLQVRRSHLWLIRPASFWTVGWQFTQKPQISGECKKFIDFSVDLSPKSPFIWVFLHFFLFTLFCWKTGSYKIFPNQDFMIIPLLLLFPVNW